MKLARAATAAAAAPNSRIIGGAGTWVPPVDEVVFPDEVLLPEDPVEELVEVDVEVLVLVPPKLDAPPPVAPLLVELLVEVETLPLEDELVELETFPLELDDTFPLDEEEVDTLPLEEVEETPPLEVELVEPSCAAAEAERSSAAITR